MLEGGAEGEGLLGTVVHAEVRAAGRAVGRGGRRQGYWDISGVKVVIDSKAIMHLIGTEMDFVDDDLRAEFVFNNPNAKVRLT